jgi:hypothetical protein
MPRGFSSESKKKMVSAVEMGLPALPGPDRVTW